MCTHSALRLQSLQIWCQQGVVSKFELGHVPFYTYDRNNVTLNRLKVTFHSYKDIFAFSFVIMSELTIIKQISVGSVQIQTDIFVQ